MTIFSVIWSVLYSLKDSPDQKHGVGNLIELLKYGSFFRDTNGLNNLQTFKRFAKILNKPNGFTVDYVAEPISTFINNCSQSEPIYKVFWHWYLLLDNHPFPIIYLLGIEHPDQWVHAVVLKGWRITKPRWKQNGSKWEKVKETMLKVRNSSKGLTVFGQVQQGEHEIEYKVTQDNSAWNLYADMCVYLKLNWN